MQPAQLAPCQLNTQTNHLIPYNLFFLRFIFIKFLNYVYVSVCGYVCVTSVPKESEGTGCPGAGVTGGCESPDVALETELQTEEIRLPLPS